MIRPQNGNMIENLLEPRSFVDAFRCGMGHGGIHIMTRYLICGLFHYLCRLSH